MNEKRIFLEKQAMTSAINAAVQHNKYKKKGTKKNNSLHIQWRGLLEEKSKKYKTRQVLRVYFSDIDKITKALSQLAPGINVSHAQKSFGLYLKYLWCQNRIQEPPSCPIDKKILDHARVKKPWTKIKSLKEYKECFNLIVTAIKSTKKTPAKWELQTFNSV